MSAPSSNAPSPACYATGSIYGCYQHLPPVRYCQRAPLLSDAVRQPLATSTRRYRFGARTTRGPQKAAPGLLLAPFLPYGVVCAKPIRARPQATWSWQLGSTTPSFSASLLVDITSDGLSSDPQASCLRSFSVHNMQAQCALTANNHASLRLAISIKILSQGWLCWRAPPSPHQAIGNIVSRSSMPAPYLTHCQGAQVPGTFLETTL
jgi:hypothetical protein